MRPPALLALAVTLVGCALFWPLPLGGTTPLTAFGDSHVWGLDHIVRMLGGLDVSPYTDRAGFPVERRAPVIGWAPALLTLPLRAAFDAAAAMQIVFLLSPALAAVAAYAWMRRAVDATPLAAASFAAAWALSAPALANLAAGNVDKAQVWVYPAWLWLAWDTRRAAWLALAPLSLLAALTEPYLGLFLPLFGIPLALLRTREPQHLAGVLGSTALGLLPAQLWFGNTHDRTSPQVFSPAPPPMPEQPIFPQQSPSADPLELIWTAPTMGVEALRPIHVVYLGIPLLIAAMFARRRGPGLALALAGIVIALGPQLILGGKWQHLGEYRYLLPMAALEAIGYPLSQGGQYYRAIPIATLGLTTLAATMPWRWAPPLFAAVSIADAIRATGPNWPRPTAALDGRAVCRAIAAGEAGAVLTLPLVGDQAQGGRKLLLAALHGRATNSLPNHLPTMLLHHETPWLRDWLAAPSAASLRGLGFSWVLHTPLGTETIPELEPEALRTWLGGPTLVDGGYTVWAVPR